MSFGLRQSFGRLCKAQKERIERYWLEKEKESIKEVAEAIERVNELEDVHKWPNPQYPQQ